jgi:hypothetical protein
MALVKQGAKTGAKARAAAALKAGKARLHQNTEPKPAQKAEKPSDAKADTGK